MIWLYLNLGKAKSITYSQVAIHVWRSIEENHKKTHILVAYILFYCIFFDTKMLRDYYQIGNKSMTF